MDLLGLVLLAALWLLVLAPTLRRKQAEFKPLDSIGDFRSHLQALARRIPVVVPPANRLPARPPWAPGFVEPAQLGLVPMPNRRRGRHRPRGAARHARRPRPSVRRSAPRRHVLRRRRRVLSALLALLVASVTLGALPGLQLHPHLRWAASGGVALLVVGYLALLVHLRRAANRGAERRVPADGQLPAPIAEDEQPVAEDERPTAELELNLPVPQEAPGLLDRSVGS
ncbi:MAG: hypothetical protein J2P59_09420 [Acidimicrobiales bacterium]|nr:hypothetical protein [Acidimicrobiales bacterium]